MHLISKVRKKNSLIRNSSYLYLSHFADYALGILFLPFIARTIGTLEFGLIGVMQTYGILITLFMEFGSPIIATRRISRLVHDKKNLKIFISNITTFKIILIPIVLILSSSTLLLVPIFANNPKYLMIVVIGSIFQGIAPTWYFQGLERMEKIAVSKTVFRLIGFIAIFLFVESSNDSWIVLFSYASSSFLICVYLFSLIIKETGSLNIFYQSKPFVLLRKSISSFLVSIIPVLYQNISLLILTTFINPVQLGFYIGANRIYKAFNSLYGPISQAFLPIVSSIDKNNKFQIKIVIIKYLIFMTLFGAFFFALNFIFADFIILILLGEEYMPAVELLRLFSIVLPLTAVSNAIGRQWLIALNKDFFYFLTQLLSSAIAFIYLFYFIENLQVDSLIISFIIYELSTITLISVFHIKNVKK